MSLLQPPAPGTGSSATSSPAYWSTAKPPKRYNGMAIASLVFAILGILAILFTYVTSGYLLSQHAFWVLLITLIPSMLAVICGHIGKHRARKVHGLGESYDLAVVSLIIGYLGGIYLASVLIYISFGF